MRGDSFSHSNMKNAYCSAWTRQVCSLLFAYNNHKSQLYLNVNARNGSNNSERANVITVVYLASSFTMLRDDRMNRSPLLRPLPSLLLLAWKKINEEFCVFFFFFFHFVFRLQWGPAVLRSTTTYGKKNKIKMYERWIGYYLFFSSVEQNELFTSAKSGMYVLHKIFLYTIHNLFENRIEWIKCTYGWCMRMCVAIITISFTL